MIRSCLRFSKKVSARPQVVQPNSIGLKRNYNIKSSEHIEKISRQLLQEDERQVAILNLPFENDYLLARRLIANGQKNLLLISKKAYREPEDALSDVVSDDLKLNVVKNVNLLSLKVGHTVKKGSNVSVCGEIAKHLENREWFDTPTAKLFMIVPDGSKHILRSILGQIIHRSHLFSNGRIELYLLIPISEYRNLMEQSTGPLFFVNSYKILFDFELLDRLVWSDLQMSHNRIKFKTDRPCYFVKLTPKRSLLEDYPPGYLANFLGFLGKLSSSRKSLLISFLEGYFPGIGLKLIDLGYSVFTRFESLEIGDFIKIFDLLMREEKEALLEILGGDHHGGSVVEPV